MIVSCRLAVGTAGGQDLRLLLSEPLFPRCSIFCADGLRSALLLAGTREVAWPLGSDMQRMCGSGRLLWHWCLPMESAGEEESVAVNVVQNESQ